MAEPRQPLGIRKEGTGVICGSPTPLWRFPAETYKRGSSSIDPEILAWLRPAKLKRRKIKPAAVDQSWEAVERAVQMRLNNLAKTPRRPPMMKPRMTPHTLATDEATRGRDDAARHARQEEADRRTAYAEGETDAQKSSSQELLSRLLEEQRRGFEKETAELKNQLAAKTEVHAEGLSNA